MTLHKLRPTMSPPKNFLSMFNKSLRKARKKPREQWKRRKRSQSRHLRTLFPNLRVCILFSHKLPSSLYIFLYIIQEKYTYKSLIHSTFSFPNDTEEKPSNAITFECKYQMTPEERYDLSLQIGQIIMSLPYHGRTHKSSQLDIIAQPNRVPRDRTPIGNQGDQGDQEEERRQEEAERQYQQRLAQEAERQRLQAEDAERQRQQAIQEAEAERIRQEELERQRQAQNARPRREPRPNTRYQNSVTGAEYERIMRELEDEADIARELTYALNACDFSPIDLNMDMVPNFHQAYAETPSISPTPDPSPIQTGNVDERISYKNAWDQPLYRKAILKEVAAWESNQVIQMTDLPNGRKAIGYRWIFSRKYGPDGTIIKYKARLVARGDTQTEGVDFSETFAPVARMDSFRLLFSIAVNEDLDIHQMDVNTAFLGAPLKEELYMRMPPPWIDNHPKGKVCRMLKSVYGLRQAGREWYQTLDEYLIHIGFERTESDHAVYRHKKYGTYLAHWVDDILIFERYANIMTELKNKLKERFKMTDCGELSYFLGMSFIRDKTKGILTISQEH